MSFKQLRVVSYGSFTYYRIMRHCLHRSLQLYIIGMSRQDYETGIQKASYRKEGNNHMDKKRNHIIDSYRGFTMISMILYHSCYDYFIVFGRNYDFLRSKSAFLWQQSICISFILVSGLVWPLGRKHVLKRGLVLLLLGSAITFVTSVFMPNEAIYYGILTFMGIATLLMLPYDMVQRRSLQGTMIQHKIFPDTMIQHEILPHTTIQHEILPGTKVQQENLSGSAALYRNIPITEEQSTGIPNTSFQNTNNKKTVDRSEDTHTPDNPKFGKNISVPTESLIRPFKSKDIICIIVYLILFALTKHVPNGYIGTRYHALMYLPEALYRFPVLTPLGLPTADFTSGDYFPVIPWIFLYMTGYHLSDFLFSNPVIKKAGSKKIPVLSWLGTKSLLVYIIHQPVCYGIIWLFCHR